MSIENRMRSRVVDASKDCGFLRVLREGCSIIDLPELAYESNLISAEASLVFRRGSAALWGRERRSSSIRMGHGVEYDEGGSPFHLFDKLAIALGGRLLHRVLLECHPIFNDDLRRCQLVGPLAEARLIDALSQRFAVGRFPDGGSSLASASLEMRETYRNFLCFLRPQEDAAAPVRVVSCDLGVIYRLSELETAIGAAVRLELASLDRVVEVWRAGSRTELVEDANALVLAAQRISVLQPSTLAYDGFGTPRLGPPRETPFFRSSRSSVEPSTSVSWAVAVEKPEESIDVSADRSIDASRGTSMDVSVDVSVDVSADVSMDVSPECSRDRVADLDPTTYSVELGPIDQLLARMLTECDACRGEWIELTARREDAVVRYGGFGWSAVRDRVPRTMVSSLHASLSRMFGITAEVGGHGRCTLAVDTGRRLSAVGWIAPKRVHLRPRASEQPLAQIRLLPAESSEGEGLEPLARAIIRCSRESRDARILLDASEFEGTDAEICRELRKHRPFADFAYVGLGEAFQPRSSVRATDADVVHQRIDDLRGCEPVIPSLVALGDVRCSAEADEAVRLALGGSYVVLRSPGTSVELATLRFLSQVNDRSIASAQLLGCVRISQFRERFLSWPAGFDGRVPGRQRLVRCSRALLFSSMVRELLADSMTCEELGRRGSAVEFVDEFES